MESERQRPEPSSRRDTASRLGLLLFLWSGVGLVYWVQTFHTLSEHAAGYTWADAFDDTWPTWLLWLALAPLIAEVDRRFLVRRSLGRRLLGHLALSLPVTAAYVALSIGVDVLRYEGFVPTLSGHGVDRFQWHLTNYWVLAGLLILLSLDHTVARQREELAEARLRALSSQVRPHFLFNSLNTVAAVLEREPARARRLLADLADNLRFTLDRTDAADAELIPCSEELALVERMLSLEQARLGDRLRLERRVEGDPGELAVPPFSIQVLVENAIRHAVEPRVEPTRVELVVAAEEDRLRVEVIDDGPGLGAADGPSPAVGARCGHGIGLDNLRRRLDVLFGDDASLAVGPARGGVGVRAAMELPARRLGSRRIEARRKLEVVDVA